MPKKLTEVEQIEREIKAAEEKLEKLKANLLNAQSRLTVECKKNSAYDGTACGASIRIGE